MDYCLTNNRFISHTYHEGYHNLHESRLDSLRYNRQPVFFVKWLRVSQNVWTPTQVCEWGIRQFILIYLLYVLMFEMTFIGHQMVLRKSLWLLRLYPISIGGHDGATHSSSYWSWNIGSAINIAQFVRWQAFIIFVYTHIWHCIWYNSSGLQLVCNLPCRYDRTKSCRINIGL